MAKKLCEDEFYGQPELNEAVCARKKGHKPPHRERWEQSNSAGTKRATVVVEWEDEA